MTDAVALHMTNNTTSTNSYTSIPNLFFGLEAALLASDDLGLAFGGLISDRRCRAETGVGMERLDVTTQSTLST